MAVKHKNLKKVVKELKGAVKAHGRQANTIEQHIKDMNAPYKMRGTALYGKIKGVDGKACWKGYRYAGTEDGKDKCVPMKKKGYGHKIK